MRFRGNLTFILLFISLCFPLAWTLLVKAEVCPPSWLISRLRSQESQEQAKMLTREGTGAEVFSGRECDLEERPLQKQC